MYFGTQKSVSRIPGTAVCLLCCVMPPGARHSWRRAAVLRELETLFMLFVEYSKAAGPTFQHLNHKMVFFGSARGCLWEAPSPSEAHLSLGGMCWLGVARRGSVWFGVWRPKKARRGRSRTLSEQCSNVVQKVKLESFLVCNKER